jgi:DNA-binding GntR family transcriptional regulator
MFPSETATHKQLRNLVADQIRAAIFEGKFKPGEWLRQEKIAQELGVSQMPVREALKELAADGLIEHVPYRGARVIAFLVEDIADLYEHRAFLEGRAAAAAATNITAEELNELRFLMDEMLRNNAPEAVNVYRELNRRFHQVIFTASRREYLIRALNQMWAAFPTMLIANFAATADQPLPERDNPDIIEHSAIIVALENHDAAQAEAAVSEHILTTGRQLLKSLRTATGTDSKGS